MKFMEIIAGGRRRGASVSASDAFTRANETPLAGSWTTITSETNMNLSANTVVPSAFGADCGVYYTGIVWPADQYSEVEVTDATTDGLGVGMGVIIRCSSVARTYYRLVIDAIGSGGNWELGKSIAGVFTQLGFGQVAFVNGQKLKLAIQGTTLKCFYNGAQIGTDVVDPDIATGSGGIGYSSTSLACSADNWAGGSYP